MKKKHSLFFILSVINFCFLSSLPAQVIIGTLIDQHGNGIAGLNVDLYISTNHYSCISDNGGSFTFTNITKVNENNDLPSNYTISNNYPNPFNPKTRIDFRLPKASKIKIELYNIVGQRIGEIIQRDFSAGSNYIDLELKGLPNGLYFARINIDDKYSIVRKLMLLYGSQHLKTSNSTFTRSLEKSLSDIPIDSLVVTGSKCNHTVFTNLPNFSGGALNLGNLLVNIIEESSCPASINYEGKTYNTILIGDQCWLKENLNVGTGISGNLGQTNNSTIEKYCYDNDPNNCSVYGGLYQWNEAMQYSSAEGAKGICPSGWHIPSYNEYQTLVTTVNGDAKALKVTGGTNSSGFSALFAGYCRYSSYQLQEQNAFVWSSTETNSSSANFMRLLSDSDSINVSQWEKVNAFSVRCIKDQSTSETAPKAPNLLSPSINSPDVLIPTTFSWYSSSGAKSYTLQVSTNSSFLSFVYNQSGLKTTSQQISNLTNSTIYFWRVRASNDNETSDWSVVWSFASASGSSDTGPCKGIQILTYDDKIYNTVQIGNHCWLKENLNVGTEINGSKSQINNGITEKYCYNDDPNNCSKYGGLYQWSEAIQYNSAESSKGICPAGWHIPTYGEFQSLSAAVNGDAGALKSTGTNSSGFSALFTGFYRSGSYLSLDYGTYIWSSTETGGSNANYMSLISDNNTIWVNSWEKSNGFSVRCMKDHIGGEAGPPTPELLNPPNNTTNLIIPLTLSWNSSTGALSYTLQVSTDNSFSSFVFNQSGLKTTSQELKNLAYNTTYYWRVNATNIDGTSNWSVVWIFNTVNEPSEYPPCPNVPTVTYGGKIYNTVQINNQCWLKENLNVGTRVNGAASQINNGTIEKYCYNDDILNCDTYGGLYQWNEAMQYSTVEGSKGICPDGWHIPTSAEFQTLLYAANLDGNTLKAVGQGTGSGAGTNTTGFSALLGGLHSTSGYGLLHESAYIYSSSEASDKNFTMSPKINGENNGFTSGMVPKDMAYSVRCLKN